MYWVSLLFNYLEIELMSLCKVSEAKALFSAVFINIDSI